MLPSIVGASPDQVTDAPVASAPPLASANMTTAPQPGTPLVMFDRQGGVWLEATGALPRSGTPLNWDELLADASLLNAAMASDPLPGLNLMPLWQATDLDGVACLVLQAPKAGCIWRKVPNEQALKEVRPSDERLLREALVRGGQTAIGTSPAWLDPGWWIQALRWAEATVKADTGLPLQDLRVTKAPWGGSAVLELRAMRPHHPSFASSPRFFFKASAGRPAEHRVLRSLLRLAPDAPVPALVAEDDAYGCFLMRAEQGHTPQTPGEHARAIRALARLQRAQVQGTPDPLWSQCQCRDGRWLAELAATLLEEIPRLLVSHGVVADSALALSGRLEAARRRCAALDASGWPLALHHEDFRPGNVLVQEDRECILDWADTVMAHPALSLLRYLEDLQGDDAAVEAATKAFVEVWGESLPLASVTAGIEAARGVAVLYETARHAQHMDIASWAAGQPAPQERAIAQSVMERLLAESARW